MTATIGEIEYQGDTLAFPSEDTAMATFMPIGPSVIVRIQALDPRAKSRLHNTLTIELTAMGNNAAAQIIPSISATKTARMPASN